MYLYITSLSISSLVFFPHETGPHGTVCRTESSGSSGESSPARALVPAGGTRFKVPELEIEDWKSWKSWKSDEVSMFSMDQWKYELFGPLSFQIFHFDAKESQRLCQCLHLQLNKGNNKSVQHRTSDPSLGLSDEDDGSSSWAAAVASWIPRELHQVLP